MTLFEKAIRHYGTTSYISGAGYILPNGLLLDFSESRDGGIPWERSLDHRSVVLLYRDVEPTDAMFRFIRLGAIRVHVGDLPGHRNVALCLTLARPPTPQQALVIITAMRHMRSLAVDVIPRRGDTRTIADHEWEPPPTPGELGRWFDTVWPER